MIRFGIKKIYYFAVLLLVTTLIGCGPNPPDFIRLKSGERMCHTKDCFLRKVHSNPSRISIDYETGVETWAWDCRVLRQRHADKAAGAPYWYEGYYMDCTYEVDFDPEGNKIDARWIGAGCFTSDGRLYNEGSFFYDE